MLTVKSYLAKFVRKILKNEDFLSYRDSSGKEWVCVFDFINGLQHKDFFKNIFSEFGVPSDRIEIKDSSIMFEGEITTTEEYERREVRMHEIEDFAFRGASELERPALEGSYNGGVNSLYMTKVDFDAAKASVLQDYAEEEQLEYLKLSFNENHSLLVSNVDVVEIAKKARGGDSYQFIIANCFFSGDGIVSKNLDEIYSEEIDEHMPPPDNIKRTFRDAVRSINDLCENGLGIKPLKFEGDNIINTTITH